MYLSDKQGVAVISVVWFIISVSMADGAEHQAVTWLDRKIGTDKADTLPVEELVNNVEAALMHVHIRSHTYEESLPIRPA